MAYIRRYDRHPLLLPPNMVPSAWDDVEIDWGHPLLIGVDFFTNSIPDLKFNYDLVKYTPASFTSAPSFQPSISGVGGYCNGSTTRWKYSASANTYAHGTAQSLVFFGVPNSGVNSLVITDEAPSDNWDLKIYTLNTNQFQAQTVFNGNYSTASTFSPYAPTSAIMTVDASANLNFFVNGKQDANFPVALGSRSSRADGSGFSVMAEPIYTGGFFSGSAYQFMSYRRALSANDAQWLSAEPFAMLMPRKRIGYYFSGSGAVSYRPRRLFFLPFM